MTSAPYGIRKPSTQRYARLPGTDARWLARSYFTWLDRVLPLVRAAEEGDRMNLYVAPIKRPAIEMRRVRDSPEATIYKVCGGFLVASPNGGEFGFRIHDPETFEIVLRAFDPVLPRYLYAVTQAIVHDIVMWSFGKYLERVKPLALPPAEDEGSHERQG